MGRWEGRRGKGFNHKGHREHKEGEGGSISLFAVVVFEAFGTEEAALGGADEPFVAVGIVGGFANGIIGDQQKNKVVLAVVDDLMRFAGWKDKGVALLQGRQSILVANAAGAGNDLVKFPLGAVGMIGIGTFPWGDAANFDIEGMAFVQIH